MPTRSRNASCPCGSGKRYKDCCGALSGIDPAGRVLSYRLIREALERTGWRIEVVRDNFARVLSALLRSDEAIEALLSGDEGFRLRIEADSRRFADALGVPYSGPTAGPANDSRTDAPRVLIVDYDVPVPDRDSGSYRMVAIIGILRSLGCAVAFVAPGAGFGGPEVEALRAFDVEVPCKPDAWGIEHVLAARGGEVDVVWVCRHYVAAEFLGVIRRCAPQALVVLDTVDLHFLREQREADLIGDTAARRRASVTRDAELAAIRSVDIAIVVSERERDAVRELVPDADVRVVSNVHALHPSGPAFAQRRDALFVGWFKHRPNVDAIQWYVADVWPLVRRRLPHARTYLIGADVPESVCNLASDGIDPLGHVPDLQPHLERCRLSIAPLRYGAGVKGKINASQAAGLPVVATSLAVEGMHLESGRDVLVADSAVAFADAVVRLHDDEALWNRLSQGGRENVMRHFSAEVARPVLAGLLAAAATRRRNGAPDGLGAKSSADNPS